MIKVLLLSIVIGLCPIAIFANIEIGSDFMVAGQLQKRGSSSANNGVSLRTHNTIFFNFMSMQIGAVVQFEKATDSGWEMIAGGGLRYGNNWFIEADGGYLKRDFGGYSESGFGGILQVGKIFSVSNSLSFKVSLPLVAKYVTSGISNNLILDYIPYLGFSYIF
jgi:hypothetical protein